MNKNSSYLLFIYTLIFVNWGCTSLEDCAGNINGTAIEDECGTCDDSDENNCVKDCQDVWGGTSIYDCDGVCNGSNISCLDCANIAFGNSYQDNCGTCDSDTTNDCVQDCAGTWGGDLLDDDCGICGGDNSSCSDCAGVPNGESVEDNCGTCDFDTTNDCVQDCAGTWGGIEIDDECGICGGISDCYGCTDYQSDNFDVNATIDDGSCLPYASIEETLTFCSGDCNSGGNCNGNCNNSVVSCCMQIVLDYEIKNEGTGTAYGTSVAFRVSYNPHTNVNQGGEVWFSGEVFLGNILPGQTESGSIMVQDYAYWGNSNIVTFYWPTAEMYWIQFSD